MDFVKEYDRIMAEQVEIALATCVDGEPNVRIMNFCYLDDAKGILYFATFGDNHKVEEFVKNASVAFTTIPHEGNAHVRVKRGMVKKSSRTIYDVSAEFIKKIPDYAITIEQAGKHLVLYEIEFHEADVTVDLENIGHILL
ncbi:pyridoxamine 5'-phosphate oxidase family protein [Acetobacterium carbinolicum]|uniref:pyridoxamine 5'-phosphate oxidase family protein n=1 Tax=Acetobacterium carbinolicum TaxID=52690 RepID=UPI0039C95762